MQNKYSSPMQAWLLFAGHMVPLTVHIPILYVTLIIIITMRMTRKRDGDIHEILDLHPLYFTYDNVM